MSRGHNVLELKALVVDLLILLISPQIVATQVLGCYCQGFRRK